ncbi:MAG TPA: efflux RND transporter periplasmic adaptor subunit [Thermoanaerobaculia bacterium]|nr:efflux RND transporter periplasmic adaptor subunit [Thermoanaerobaculia bacterium]
MRSTFSLLLVLLAFLGACARPQEVPEEAAPLPVKVEKAARASFQPTLTLLGVVRPGGEAQVVIPVAGRLHYPARFRDGLSSGLSVRTGEVLARIDNQDAEQTLAEARLRLEASSKELARYQKAFDNGVVSGATLAQYKAQADLDAQRLTAARERRQSLELRSPVSGWLLVEKRLPAEGEVQAGTPLARIAAGGPPKVEARAAAGDRSQLREGLAVRFVLSGTSAVAGRGVVREISPVVDAGGTVAVVAEVTEGATLPAPGEGVEVQVELDQREATITVPEEALVLSEAGAAVFVDQGGMARRRPVTTGGRAGGRVEVLGGISPGDKVVVDGAALLSEGARVTPVAAAAGTPGETPADAAAPAGGSR